MSVPEKYISVEDKLTEMFATLPLMQNGIGGVAEFQPILGYGDEKELNAFLKMKEKGESPYPLIWLLYPYKEIQTKTHVEVSNIQLILAVKSNMPMLNFERMEVTFNAILIPLYNNITNLFKRANIVNVSGDYDVIKYPNYSSTDRSEETYGNLIWDAMKLEFSIKIKSTCFKAQIF